MSSLESLKKELMKKPDVVDRKPVFVLVKEFIDETEESAGLDRDDIAQSLIEKKLTRVSKKVPVIPEKGRKGEKGETNQNAREQTCHRRE